MTYLPPKPVTTTTTLSGTDTLPITQSGLAKITTLATLAAFINGTTPTAAPIETLTVATPTAQTAGAAFVLRGTYANVTPTALDSSLDGGATWMAATSPTISGGAYSFSLSVPAANASQVVKVRDHNAQGIVATSGAFAVAAVVTQPTYTESPSGTAVTTVGPTITDANGNVSSLNSSGQVVTNGAVETSTANVNELYYKAHIFYQRNTAGNWYQRTAVNAYQTNPVASPLPTASASGTVITTVGPQIIDAAGNTYAINSSGQVVTNSVAEDGASGRAYTASVTKIAYFSGQFYQQANNIWYTRTGPTATYTQTNDPTTATQVGGGTYFQVANGNIYTPTGAVFHAKGVNVTPYTNYQPSTYAAVKALFPGINFIRMVTAAGYAQGGQNAATVAQFISDATSDHCVVLVDNHTLGTTATGSTLQSAVSWYQGLANTYKSNPYVWFGSENEPDSQNYGDIAAAQTATYNAVRGTGNGTIVVLGLRGGGYSEWMSGQGSTWTVMSNVVRDVHFYGYLTFNYGNGTQFDIGSTATAFANEIAAVQAYHSADGVMPVIIGEFGVSTSGDANSYDNNGSQVVSTVLGSSYGFAAWALNGTGRPGGDSLSDNGTTLTSYGQQVAARIAQNP